MGPVEDACCVLFHNYASLPRLLDVYFNPNALNPQPEICTVNPDPPNCHTQSAREVFQTNPFEA